MKTSIPQNHVTCSRLIDPPVNGASKPAVPVSFLPPPVAQKVMPPGDAPVQRTIKEAREWVKSNTDKTNYPINWTKLPRATEIDDYINKRKPGWNELKIELDGPKKKKTTAKTGGTSSASKSWQDRKQKLSDKVDAANDAIKLATGSVNDFYKKLLDLPANISVKINSLLDAAAVKLSKEHSRLAYFSTSLLEITKEEPTVKKATPEIQTAIIQDTNTSALSLKISGNNSNVNNFLSTALGGKTLDQGYTSTVRPFHIKRKAETLEGNVKKKKPEQIKRLKLTQVPTQPEIGDFKKDTVNDSFVLKDGTGTPLTPDKFKEMVTKAFAYDLHKSTKTAPQNRQRKGARHFVKKHQHSGMALSTALVSVPVNAKNIHAESAILEELKTQADKVIRTVGGTKVACTACQTYYTKLGKEALLGDNTSFAWLSESSINQLGFDADKVTEYLEEIKKVLDSRLAQLRFFEGKSGTFGDENLVSETDMDTDSEDEAAIDTAAKGTILDEAADEVMKLL
jgi:hypothetical protein